MLTGYPQEDARVQRPMRAIVVRHYKTLINESGLIMGWGDAPPVKGWEADMVYVNSVLVERDIPFSVVYTSYLQRARRTGMFYAKKRGIHLVRDTQALNEINYGKFYKTSKSWVETNIPQHKKDPDFVYPEGESFSQMQQRSVEFFKLLTHKHSGKTILVVVHAGVIRGLISYFLGLPYAENLKRKITHRYIGDFCFEGGECVGYDELGTRSGFVTEGAISIPWSRRLTPSALA